MNQSQKSPQPQIAAPERQRALTLEDDRAFRERGYDPYATVVHVKDSRARDIWRSKPKRA